MFVKKVLISQCLWLVPTITNYALCIMNSHACPHNYELLGRPQGFAPTSKFNSSDVFPNNYELCIMNYELNQYSIAVVDFVLYDLGCKASEFLSLWFEINV